jgi:uncharacterized protein with HEPN domain
MRDVDVARIRHALDAARKAVSVTSRHSVDSFKADELLPLAVVRLLEIIGEAAAQASDDLRDRYPDLPWRPMIGMRNRLIHGYHDVNLDIVWDTVKKDLPPLVSALSDLLETEGIRHH